MLDSQPGARRKGAITSPLCHACRSCVAGIVILFSHISSFRWSFPCCRLYYLVHTVEAFPLLAYPHGSRDRDHLEELVAVDNCTVISSSTRRSHQYPGLSSA